MADQRDHWDDVYGARAEEDLTWFEAMPLLSLELVQMYLRPGDAFIDVGAGASRLVDALLDAWLGPLTVLDISGAALARTRERLGTHGDEVTWIEADVTQWQPDRTYAVWHDRAVFHFLTEADDRAAYVRALSAALVPGGTAIIATFAKDGPEMCSGLPVVRYAAGNLARELDRLVPGVFELMGSRRHMHVTPKGNRQNFQYSVLGKKQLTP